jgi:phosphatidylglycerophosphate synthase
MTRDSNNPLVIALVIIVVLLLVGGLGYGMMNFFGGHYSGYYGFGWLFGIVALIAAIWVIYDVLVNNRRLSDGMKVLWVVCAVLFNIITAVIYYLVGRNSKNDLFKKSRR